MRSDRSTSMRQAALGTALVFTASGALLGTWVSRIPAVVASLGITAGELGRALLALGIGSLLSMPLTGHACRRVGSRAWVAGTSVLAAAVLSCVGLATNLVQLTVALFALGMVYGSWDVAMNIQGSAVDQRAGREWMPRYHACWSLGSILGAAAGSLAARGDVGTGAHFTAAAGCAAAVAFAGLTRYVDERATAGEPGAAGAGGGRRLVTDRALLLIGALTLCATVIEGAAADWLALFLHTGRGLSEASAALGYTVFATAMTVVRFAGTPVAARLGRAGAVRVGGVLGVAGVLVTVLSPWLPLTYAGALLWAAGVCLVFPAAVSAAGETGRPAESIALVTTIGYGSILVGPPLIGALADVIGMGRALLTLAVLAAAVAVLAPAVRPRAARDRQSGSASIAR
ncbi:MFS transporter [Dactylosporangium sp. NPDC005555]|uniref:MFS transporter n=1 Tax=Dactylosporangium sp. NPDC005555 TaxID=3154889 RepID=UPI0033A382B0